MIKYLRDNEILQLQQEGLITNVGGTIKLKPLNEQKIMQILTERGYDPTRYRLADENNPLRGFVDNMPEHEV